MLNGIGYSRLSRDEDRENYESILNQNLIIAKYAEKMGINLIEIVEDDNVSGYTFDRPGFNRVMGYLEEPGVDVIIAKDLSRIGRHNALTLLFLERVKNCGKRVILPDEASGGYDSGRDDDDIIGIKTWYNERYVKDISKKVRSALKVKQEKGDLIIKPFYGYEIDKKQNKLVVEEETAQIVREIFKLYIEGNGYRKIAEILNERRIDTPSRLIKGHYEKKGLKYNGCVSDTWFSMYVGRILKNDIYIGNLRQCKTRKPYIKSRAVKTRPEDQLVFENHHEPIISREDFELVQSLIKQRNSTKFRGTGMPGTKNVNVFSGMLFCADCGSFMTAHSPQKWKKTYVCGTYHRRGGKFCTSHRIREEELITHIKTHLLFIRSNMSDFISSVNKDIERQLPRYSGHKTLLNNLEKKLELSNREYREMLAQKIRDLAGNPEHRETIERAYRDMEQDQLREIAALGMQIENVRSVRENVVNFEEKTKTAIGIFDSIIEAGIPKRSQLEMIVGRIYISPEGNVDIHLREDIDDLCEYRLQAHSVLSII
jgi:site-specific DNA recombinase